MAYMKYWWRSEATGWTRRLLPMATKRQHGPLENKAESTFRLKNKRKHGRLKNMSARLCAFSVSLGFLPASSFRRTRPFLFLPPSLFGLAFLRRRTFSPICVSSFRNIDSACYGFALVREQSRLFYFDSKFTPSKGVSVEDWALAIIVSLKKKRKLRH